MSDSHQPPVLAIQVGNTRIKFAIFREKEPSEVAFISKDDVPGAIELAMKLYEMIGAEVDSAVLVASVNAPVATALVSALRDQLACEIYLVPEDMPVPIGVCLAPGAKPGVDRLLNAAAAFDTLKQACIVIDAGTCITVDFIDGEGVFHGGAIAPGVQMQLKAMHEFTAALPSVAFEAPSGLPWGADTQEAMNRGVYHGARGLVWRLIEKYAEQYGGFPPTVATGGDAAMLFAEDELINQIVPDLVLRGMALAARHALESSSDDDEGESRRSGFGVRDLSTGSGFSLLPGQTESRPMRQAGTQSRQAGTQSQVERDGNSDDDLN